MKRNGHALGARPGPLADAEDDEFRWLHRAHPDFDDQASKVTRRARVEFRIALDVVR